MTREEWVADGERRFGPDKKKWRFVCPVCKRVTSVQEWLDAGAPAEAAYSCVGRHRDDVDCDYAGGGFIKLNPVVVDCEGFQTTLFDFADPEESDDLRGAMEVDRACS